MHHTVISARETVGLGEILVNHPPGTFALTPASRIAIPAICNHQHLLYGKGIDWGSGTGCLAITAARIKQVEKVIGLEISAQNVTAARKNACLNGVNDKVTFIQSDSYLPLEGDQHVLDALKRHTDFILANPPSSEGDDGFEYRRCVLRGARKYLRTDGVVFLNISYQYGRQRVEHLIQQVPEYAYGGVLASTGWAAFDLQRSDLYHCLELYVEEEHRGGLEYDFGNPEDANVLMNAQSAIVHFQQTGQSPLTRWQTHLFRFIGE